LGQNLRLELQKALLDARLANTIYWTDSKVVLSWISSESRRFKQYIAVRVGEILELTSLSKWLYIPSKLNVAGIATRWQSNDDINVKC
jgi:hypothetical protein